MGITCCVNVKEWVVAVYAWVCKGLFTCMHGGYWLFGLVVGFVCGICCLVCGFWLGEMHDWCWCGMAHVGVVVVEWVFGLWWFVA